MSLLLTDIYSNHPVYALEELERALLQGKEDFINGRDYFDNRYSFEREFALADMWSEGWLLGERESAEKEAA